MSNEKLNKARRHSAVIEADLSAFEVQQRFRQDAFRAQQRLGIEPSTSRKGKDYSRNVKPPVQKNTPILDIESLNLALQKRVNASVETYLSGIRGTLTAAGLVGTAQTDFINALRPQMIVIGNNVAQHVLQSRLASQSAIVLPSVDAQANQILDPRLAQSFRQRHQASTRAPAAVVDQAEAVFVRQADVAVANQITKAAQPEVDQVQLFNNLAAFNPAFVRAAKESTQQLLNSKNSFFTQAEVQRAMTELGLTPIGNIPKGPQFGRGSSRDVEDQEDSSNSSPGFSA